ncbi:MAG TPA: inorganic diphosphatase [Acidimicrobiia bacterium]|nr:inorganic diphosphatase [Acidimicrobiia bacterium]
MPTIPVFVENPAGSRLKHHHDEETLELLRVEPVSGAYPYPYGFIPGTRGPDGDCVDCFIISDRLLRTGELVDCEPIALMEQWEAGVVDDNVLAVPVGEPLPDLAPVIPVLTRGILQLFSGMPGRETAVGRFLPAEDAVAYLERFMLRGPGA